MAKKKSKADRQAMRASFGYAGHPEILYRNLFRSLFPVKSVAKSSQGIGDKTVLFSCTYHSIMAIFLSLSFALMKCNLKNCARQIVGFLLERPRCLAQNFKYFVLIKIFLISLSLFGGIYVLYVHL